MTTGEPFTPLTLTPPQLHQVAALGVRLRPRTLTVVPFVEDPAPHPFPCMNVRIRTDGDHDMFLTAHHDLGKPVVDSAVHGDLSRFTFLMQCYRSGQDGQFYCTLLHEASGRYLALDEVTEQPVLRCPLRTLRCVVSEPPTDICLRRPPGSRPLAAGEPDRCQTDRCCFFKFPDLDKQTKLVPMVCQDKGLSYNLGTGAVTAGAPPDRENFTVHPVREHYRSSIG